jgi:signal transduction histidine kinase
VYAFRYDQAENHRFAILFTEITARKRGEAAMRQIATVEERQRLSRDLHDAVKQILFAATTLSDSLPRLWAKDPSRAKEYTQEVTHLNRAALAEMDMLLLEMRPESLVKAPFMDLLNNLCYGLRGRKKIDIHLNYQGSDNLRLPADTQIALYRLTQEALNNIAKHSEATLVEVACICNGDSLRLTIQDDGQGFDARRTTVGIGLNSMRERADAVGATLTITSEVGQGTTIQVHWQHDEPLPDSTAET